MTAQNPSEASSVAKCSPLHVYGYGRMFCAHSVQEANVCVVWCRQLFLSLLIGGRGKEVSGVFSIDDLYNNDYVHISM